jgi:hypothetical protein
MASAWRMRPATRWLTLAALGPTLYYAFRTTVLLNFVPLGRFTVVQLSLLLPFVVSGWSWVVTRYGGRAAVAVARASIVLAVVFPLALGAYTTHNDSTAATVLKPISPLATNPRWVMRAADVIRTTVVTPGRTLLFDEDTRYHDLQVGFFARLDGPRTLRMRHVDPSRLRDRIAAFAPDTVVVFEYGRLLAQPWVAARDGRLTIDGLSWEERQVADLLAPHVRIFDRAPGASGHQRFSAYPPEKHAQAHPARRRTPHTRVGVGDAVVAHLQQRHRQLEGGDGRHPERSLSR